MKLFLVYFFGLLGFVVLLGGVGRMEFRPDGLWTGFLISMGGFCMIIASLLVGKYISKKPELTTWERW